KIKKVLKKLMAVRLHRRSTEVGDMDKQEVLEAMNEVGLNPEMADAIFRLTALCTFEERFVIPPSHREEAIEMTKMVLEHKGEVGFGFTGKPERI
ncbi:MAG: nitrate reductase subunit beta, partial [Bacteriovoracaceae bacterium]|nr:nitrate reductase subunit beta [Bacteriovoracaceae bacterium]